MDIHLNNIDLKNMKKLQKRSLVILLIIVAGIVNLIQPGNPSNTKNSAWASVDNTPLSDDPIMGKTYLPLLSVKGENNWPMAGANPQRTSWTPEEVTGHLHVVWYRPIEAYISQNVQIITYNGLLYVSTAKGLYALNANTGAIVWRFDTKMPLGNSPTIHSGILYVGGYDRKLHALNAMTGEHLWSFDGANAGYDTNPLVVEGKVILGNRDGTMYAIGANGSRDQGQLVWSFKAGGPIHLSAAYNQGVIYFAADDNYAYALNASNGSLLWKSAKLPGDGYHSYWPVVYRDKVVFSAALSYRMDQDPGTDSVKDDNGNPYLTHGLMQRSDIFSNAPNGALLGPTSPAQDWTHGYPIIDGSRITEYLENNPQSDSHKHKPWRRTYIVLNASNGSEYTFDSDHDGSPEYAPMAYWGTNSGNRYPPVVGPDDIIYQNNIYNNISDAQGKVMGWKLGTQYLSVIGGQAAIAEPQAISMGGNLIYRNLCCDRLGSYFDTRASGFQPIDLWSYNLSNLAPGYDSMWTILPGWPRLQGWYKGNSTSVNGIYHNHGDQNPLIPYKGHIYVHRSNAIFAFGTEPAIGKLPLLQIAPGTDTGSTITTPGLQERLEEEVQKIVTTNFLRPGYYNNGQWAYPELADYFNNPGDTLYTLSIAYPYLSSGLQLQTKDYLQRYFTSYFDPTMYSSIGWADGAAREAMPIPPDVEPSIQSSHAREVYPGFSWTYPQNNFYSMWKYALFVAPEQTGRIYDLAKSKIQVPVPSIADSNYFHTRPYELNAYIAGYIGFLNLQDLAGKAGTDAQLRTNVTNELNRLLALRSNNFSKDDPWGGTRYHKKTLSISINFLMMVPELGQYLHDHALSKVQDAVSEYEYVAPYWFVSRYESTINEGVASALYNYAGLFKAKAFILEENRDELTHYLDVPGFAIGDLFYIQNIVASIEAPAPP